MCKSCVEPVYTVLKRRGSVYNLCAAQATYYTPVWKTTGLPATFPHIHTHRFPTIKTFLLYLFSGNFSPLSTRLITRTII